MAAHLEHSAPIWPSSSRLNSVGVGMSEGLEELTVFLATQPCSAKEGQSLLSGDRRIGSRRPANKGARGDVLAPLASRAGRWPSDVAELVGARKILEKARIFAFCLACCCGSIESYAQAPSAPAANPVKPAAAAPVLPAGVTPPSGYVIGPEDQLGIV